MTGVYFITHPDVLIDADVPVTEWPLSPRGRQRMRAVLRQPWMAGVRAVWCSTERKAIDGAEILGASIGVSCRTMAALGENDRSSTGYLPRAEFEATADAFFADPTASVRGWERAADAQARIVAAVAGIVAAAPAWGDVAIVSHGGVGTLLLCHIKRCRIARSEDQPMRKGGNYFCFDAALWVLRHGWAAIDGGSAAGA